MNKSVAIFLHFVPVVMLVLAVGPWPYSYYMLLRIVVFAAALLLASLIYQRAKSITAWTILFVITAIIFNPFIPLHLTRGVWSILNILAGGLFVVHFVMSNRESSAKARG